MSQQRKLHDRITSLSCISASTFRSTQSHAHLLNKQYIINLSSRKLFNWTCYNWFWRKWKHLGIFNCGHRLPTDDSISLHRRRFDTILENEKRVCVCSLHVLYQQNMFRWEYRKSDKRTSRQAAHVIKKQSKRNFFYDFLCSCIFTSYHFNSLPACPLPTEQSSKCLTHESI